MKVNLDKPYSWKGQSYQQGEAVIPEDMAIALGIEHSKPEAKKLEPKEQVKAVETVVETKSKA